MDLSSCPPSGCLPSVSTCERGGERERSERRGEAREKCEGVCMSVGVWCWSQEEEEEEEEEEESLFKADAVN